MTKKLSQTLAPIWFGAMVLSGLAAITGDDLYTRIMVVAAACSGVWFMSLFLDAICCCNDKESKE